MSNQITTAFVQQYGSTVEFLVQQKGSRLRGTARNETIKGKTEYFDQLGSRTARKVTTRHGDSPLADTPHARRRVTTFSYDDGDLLDTFDKVRTLIDPSGPYTQAIAWALGRGMDDEIIAAFFGTAYTGEDGSTTVSFPSGQQVAVNSWTYGSGSGNAGLTISKLIEAKVLLGAAEADDPSDPTYIAVHAAQLGNLLATTEATSADYNTVKTLVNGEINTFMGFTFVHVERLPTDGSGYRRVPVWKRSGMLLAVGMEPTFRVTERADKRFSWYYYGAMDIGATRMQEEKVVEIKCA